MQVIVDNCRGMKAEVEKELIRTAQRKDAAS